MFNLAAIKEKFSGKGGHESESVLCDNNADRDEGFVSFWSNKADLAHIIERCGSCIKRADPVGDGFQLEIDRKAFRGIQYAFKRIDNPHDEETKKRTRQFKEPVVMPLSDEKMAEIANNSANLGEVAKKIGWEDNRENRVKLSMFFAQLRKTIKVKNFPRGRQKKT